MLSIAKTMGVRPLILVVDDEKRVRQVVRKYLEQADFRVIEAVDGREALMFIERQLPDLIVLDVMLPSVDGFTITEMLRKPDNLPSHQPNRNHVPIILLTARRDEMDRVLGFEMGVDDYVTKPFSPRELVGRVAAVLRRSLPSNTKATAEVVFGEFKLNATSRTLMQQDKVIGLTKTEFDLLFFLSSHAEQVFTHEHILDVVWHDYPDVDTSVVTSCIYRLRGKIEQDKDNPMFLQTVWGVGYVFKKV